VAVVGNLEFDHADIYNDLEAIRIEFRRLVRLIPRQGLLIVGADSDEAFVLRDEAHCPVESFGLSSGADWKAVSITPVRTGTTFWIERDGEPFVEIASPLLGDYNVRNVLAATAMVTAAGVGAEDIAKGVATFEGVKRRLESLGEVRGVTIYDDFAHHPTAVAETLAAVRAAYSGRRIWAIFEPRSATTCRRIMEADLASALMNADEVVLAPVYRKTVAETIRLSPERVIAMLTTNGVRARHLPKVNDIVKVVVEEAREGDQIVIMSNGAFGGIHNKLLTALSVA
jgi:UDP-N-acetylmuramate: L-alanyl-gamma-D-glutamyl-meso-diaminopimelate ligase